MIATKDDQGTRGGSYRIVVHISRPADPLGLIHINLPLLPNQHLWDSPIILINLGVLKVNTEVGDDGASPTFSPLANFPLLNEDLLYADTGRNYGGNPSHGYTRTIHHLAGFEQCALLDEMGQANVCNLTAV